MGQTRRPLFMSRVKKSTSTHFNLGMKVNLRNPLNLGHVDNVTIITTVITQQNIM